jgi:hypothetical protein
MPLVRACGGKLPKPSNPATRFFTRGHRHNNGPVGKVARRGITRSENRAGMQSATD